MTVNDTQIITHPGLYETFLVLQAQFKMFCRDLVQDVIEFSLMA